MAEFQTPVDIANRALQLCGSGRLDATLGFSEVSKRASETQFAYGKLRRAELKRNVWTFATRKAALRPIVPTTMQLAAALWSASATYFQGSLVADAQGTIWQSKIAANTANQPGGPTPVWETYFGPQTVTPFAANTAYQAGELVYTNTGNKLFNVYLSRVGGNDIHPALPTQWSVSAVYRRNDVVQTFTAWAALTSYSKGHGVLYTDGLVYVSKTDLNVGNPPSPATAAYWVAMPVLTLAGLTVPSGSTPIDEWSQSDTYAISSFAMFNGVVYFAIAASTGQFPNAAASAYWTALTGGTLYMSLFDLNLGNDPASAPAAWDASTTYSAAAAVTGSDGMIYTSVGNGNQGNDPTLDDGTNWTGTGGFTAWTTVFTQGGGNALWTQIGGASFPYGVGLSTISLPYPVGSGPSEQTLSNNVYRLPAGYLRQAPQNPKAGSMSYLGAPSNLLVTDWKFENGFLVSASSGPLVLRFVADVQDVSTMDDMFCEGLACRVALAVCEPLTQSGSKLGTIAKEYDRFMGEARLANAVEAGFEEPPLDDYIACRA